MTGDPTKDIVIVDGMDSIDASLLDANLDNRRGGPRFWRSTISQGPPAVDRLLRSRHTSTRDTGVALRS